MPVTVTLPAPITKCQRNSNRICGAQYASQEWNRLNYSKIEFFMVCLANMTLYTTSQLCLTGFTSVFRVSQELLFVTGVLNPNNQYNICWIKYNHLSICSFIPRLILGLNFSFLCNEKSQSEPWPQTVYSVDMNYVSSLYIHSSENSSNGKSAVFKYHSTR